MSDMEGVKKNAYGYKVNEFYCHKSDPLWAHTVDRMEGWKKTYSEEDFLRKTLTRIKRITKKEKLYYSIAVLIDMGFSQEIIDLYDAKIIMEELII